MHFCKVCGNMYYLKIAEDDNNNIMYYCRKCGDKDEQIINSTQSFCISKTHIKKTTEIYKNIINEYTKLDPTLPRIKNMLCPNEECNSNNEAKDETKDETKDEAKKYPEIIYLRYDNNNMKYIYLCSECDYTWTNI
jgi:DNA-directed RNA polymerase subunit M/transcription elongation factor TFIIS